jgi:pimeloyl-ACP methyl ester carboxylesterase
MKGIIMRKITGFLLILLFAMSVFAQDDAPVPQPVTLEAADGLMLQGDYYPQPQAAPAVLLLHMLGSERGAWEPLITPLYAAGYSLLAVDIRGHGVTGGERDWVKAEADHQAWLDWLREQPTVQPDSVSIVGASIGGNMALIGCANDAACVTAVALSPGVDYRDVRPGPAVESGLEGRSALLAGGWGDSSVAADIFQMASRSNAEIGIRIYDTNTHGTNLLSGDDGARVIDLIINWLDEHQDRFTSEAG